MNVGDLVRHTKMASGVGVITHINAGWTAKQVIVKWSKPVWFNPTTGLSHEYPHNLELLSEAQ